MTRGSGCFPPGKGKTATARGGRNVLDEAHQIIISTQVDAEASDQGQLLPLLDE